MRLTLTCLLLLKMILAILSRCPRGSQSGERARGQTRLFRYYRRSLSFGSCRYSCFTTGGLLTWFYIRHFSSWQRGAGQDRLMTRYWQNMALSSRLIDSNAVYHRSCLCNLHLVQCDSVHCSFDGLSLGCRRWC